jgi:HAD superfamily hydrolase (TIGR01450 family)
MNKPQAIILDLDGTVHRSGLPIPGAAAAITELLQRRHPLIYVTNALESPDHYAAALNRIGVPARASQIVTAPMVLTRHLSLHMPDATLYVISDPPLPESLSRQFRLSEDPQEIDAVVISCDQEFDSRKLNIGFQALRRGARFLAINADATCPVPGGVIPDAGAIIGALHGCSKREVELIAGKPSSIMTAAILEAAQRPSGECWMVGDSLETDILMGQRAGMSTALVLTGVTQPSDLQHLAYRPDHVLESLSGLPALLEQGRRKL